MTAGASDVLFCASNADVGRLVAARLERWRQIDAFVDGPAVADRLVGASARWRGLLRTVVEAAVFADAPVLLSGESGTGKELIARLIHELDQRDHKGNLVVLDCSTIVPELSGSEFFGHERGAFTGAVVQRDGAFAAADRGTLFLDEVGELPPALQAQLLRVIQEGTYKRVGGNTWYRTQFRLVSATNRNLSQMASKGLFRSDLYFRIAGVTIELPALREHCEDILPLARHFAVQSCGTASPPALDPLVQAYLLARDYPGNVRDLRQVVTRMMHRWVGCGPLTVGAVPEHDRPAIDPALAAGPPDGFVGGIRQALAMGKGLREIGRDAEELALRIVLEEEDGNLQSAARRLGVTDRALQLRRQAQRRIAQGNGNLDLPGPHGGEQIEINVPPP
jgi:transcriptional regulator with GAF, ATPase, and Fis domain